MLGLVPRRWRAWFERTFVDRQLYIRTGAETRYVHLGRRRQILIAGAASVLVLYAVLMTGLAGYGWRAGAPAADRADALQAANTRLERALARATHDHDALAGRLAGLETDYADARTELAELKSLRDERTALLAERADLQARIEQLGEERDDFQAMAERLSRGARETEAWLKAAVREKTSLIARLNAVEARLDDVLGERDVSRRTEKGLSWRVEILENRLESLRQAYESAQAWFGEFTSAQIEQNEAVIAETGLDVDRLITRASRQIEVPQGGPFEEIAGDPLYVDPQPVAYRTDWSGPINRMAALREVVGALPLTAPISNYRITSGFGPRRDPIRGRSAMHSGMDFGAPRGTEIFAPSEGTVIYAGWKGAYGRYVEIDHGFGLTTRYAHMAEIKVEKGDRVGYRQPIGVIGSSGRSTGRHLHYEVRVDGEAVDPAKFLSAGRQVVHVLQEY